jgi:hypothetical protein
VGWVTPPAARGLEELFSAVLERFLQPMHRAKGSSSPLMLCVCIVRIRLEIHVNNKQFCMIFLLNPNFLVVHRNRYSEGMEDGQKTPRGHPDLIPT